MRFGQILAAGLAVLLSGCGGSATGDDDAVGEKDRPRGAAYATTDALSDEGCELFDRLFRGLENYKNKDFFDGEIRGRSGDDMASYLDELRQEIGEPGEVRALYTFVDGLAAAGGRVGSESTSPAEVYWDEHRWSAEVTSSIGWFADNCRRSEGGGAASESATSPPSSAAASEDGSQPVERLAAVAADVEKDGFSCDEPEENTNPDGANLYTASMVCRPDDEQMKDTPVFLYVDDPDVLEFIEPEDEVRTCTPTDHQLAEDAYEWNVSLLEDDIYATITALPAMVDSPSDAIHLLARFAEAAGWEARTRC